MMNKICTQFGGSVDDDDGEMLVRHVNDTLQKRKYLWNYGSLWHYPHRLQAPE